MHETEIWRPVVGYESRYEISNMGRLVCLFTRNQFGLYPCRREVHGSRYNGYIRVIIMDKRVGRSCPIHRLVAEAFLIRPEGKTEVNHKNGKKEDNRLENLDWVTRSENIRHAHENGLMHPRRGEGCHLSKFKEWQVLEIRERFKNGEKTSEMAKEYGVKHDTISYIVNRIFWTHI